MSCHYAVYSILYLVTVKIRTSEIKNIYKYYTYSNNTGIICNSTLSCMFLSLRYLLTPVFIIVADPDPYLFSWFMSSGLGSTKSKWTQKRGRGNRGVMVLMSWVVALEG